MNWRRFLRRDEADSEQRRELESYLEITTDECIARGMEPDTARRAARRRLGNLTKIQEEVYRMNTLGFLDSLARDLRHALRSMRHNPAFTLIATMTLALGIGATTAVFTIVNSVLLQPLPFPDPGRVVALREITPGGLLNPAVQTQNILDWKARNRSFETIAALQQIPMNIAGTGEADQVNGLRVSADFFPLLDVRPQLGRWFTSEEDLPGSPARVILSYGFWQRRFGGDPAVIGTGQTINGNPGEIVGVMPARFVLPNLNPELFVPAQINPAFAPQDGRNFMVYGRLREGISISVARDEIRALHAQSVAERPRFNAGWTATAAPLLDDAVRNVRTALLVLLGAVLFVLLLCCVNVANLYLMRTHSRMRELTVRHALGAGRARLIRQLVTESLLLTAMGGLLGLGLAYAGVPGLLALVPADLGLPRVAEVETDATVLFASLGVSALAGILVGLIPALVADFHDPARALSHAGRSIAGRRGFLGNALVVAEVALALVLVCGAGLMARSFIEINRIDPGFRPEKVLTMRMLLLPSKYGPNVNARADVVARMLEQIRAVPQVSGASSIHVLPMSGLGSGSGVYRADRPEPPAGSMPAAGFSVISDGYFQTMGIPLIAGREFDSRDRMGAPLVAVINQAAARMLYGGEEALGKRIMVIWNGPPEAEIVGIAKDSRFEGMRTDPGPFIFLPNAQRPNLFTAFVVRTSGDPLAAIRAVRDATCSVEPDQGVLETSTLEREVSDSIANPRLQSILFGAFGVLALVIASIGVYGVLAYAVAQRTREMGVRIALGAAPATIRREVLSSGLRFPVLGLLIGLGVAFAFTRYLESLLYAIRPTDPAVFIGAVAVLLTVCAAACYVPARRAAAVDPIETLRGE